MFQIPEATSIWGLALPHFLLGLGIGIVDSALMPLLANLVDEEGHGEAYGSVYAIAQTAVSLAYGLGQKIASHPLDMMAKSGSFHILFIINYVVS